MPHIHVEVSKGDQAAFAPGKLELLELTYADVYPDLHFQAEVILLGREEMQQLNREKRSIDEPTDVLSFPTLQNMAQISALGPLEQVLIGSIAICPDKAKEYKEELVDLVHHGLLHLLGFDHETERVEWDKEEQKILSHATKHGLIMTGVPHD